MPKTQFTVAEIEDRLRKRNLNIHEGTVTKDPNGGFIIDLDRAAASKKARSAEWPFDPQPGKLDHNMLLAIASAENSTEMVSAALLSGEPGVGKTRWAKELARLWGSARADKMDAQLIKYQCNETTGAEQIVFDLGVGATVRSLATGNVEPGLISLGVLPLAFQISQTRPVVLLIDEIDKARLGVDNMLLDALQSGEVFDPALDETNTGQSIKANLKNLIVVLTTNEMRMLSEPLYRRLRRISMMYPSPEKVYEIVRVMIGENTFEKMGFPLVKRMIEKATVYRKSDPIKMITPDEIARIFKDYAVMEDPQIRMEIMRGWFSPHTQDQELLEKLIGKNYKPYIA